MGNLEITIHEIEEKTEQQKKNQLEIKGESDTNGDLNTKKLAEIILWTVGISFVLMVVTSLLLQNSINSILNNLYNPENSIYDTSEFIGTNFDLTTDWKHILLAFNLQSMNMLVREMQVGFEFATVFKIRIFILLLMPFIAILTSVFVVKKFRKVSLTSNILSTSFFFGLAYAIVLGIIASMSGSSVMDDEQIYQLDLSYSLLNVFLETFLMGSILYYLSISIVDRKELKSISLIFLINRALKDLGKLYGILIFLVLLFILYQGIVLDDLTEELFIFIMVLLVNGVYGISLLLTGNFITQQEPGEYYQLSLFNEIIMVGNDSDLKNLLIHFKVMIIEGSPFLLLLLFAIPFFIFFHSGWNIAKKMKEKVLIRCLLFSTVFTMLLTVIAYFSSFGIQLYEVGEAYSNMELYLIYVDMMDLFVRSFVLATIATFLGAITFTLRKKRKNKLKELKTKEVRIDEE